MTTHTFEFQGKTWTLFKRPGHQAESARPWYFRISVAGKRQKICCQTAELEEAKKIAREAIKKSAADSNLFHAWRDNTKVRQEPFATLAEIVSCYGRYAKCAAITRRQNCTQLRALCRYGGAAAIDAEPAAVDPLSTEVLTAKLMRDMQANLLEAAGADNHKQDTAKVTANSIRRMARSLFTPDMLAVYKENNLRVDIADLMSVKPLPEGGKEFKAIDPALIQRIQKAAPALREEDPNLYRIYLLSFSAGMRKKEIAYAQWNWITPHPKDPAERLIHIQTTAEFRPKGRRDRFIYLEPFVLEELRQLRITRINGDGADHILDGAKAERGDKSFRRFSAWLVGLGWDRKKKAHEFRKACGSIWNEKLGLSAAQDLLGHSTPVLTKSTYVSRPDPVPLRILG